jgi:hypothetical protein
LVLAVRVALTKARKVRTCSGVIVGRRETVLPDLHPVGKRKVTPVQLVGVTASTEEDQQ